MPLYEYQCETCCHTFEYLALSKNDEPHDCPKCGERNINRLMSCASFLGGSGASRVCAPSAPSGFS